MQKRSTGGGGQKKQPAALVSLQKFSTSGRCVPPSTRSACCSTHLITLLCTERPPALAATQCRRRYEPRGALARKPDAKPSSLPDTNINPEMTFKINSTIDLKYNLQKDLQGEVRKREEGQLVKVFHRSVMPPPPPPLRQPVVVLSSCLLRVVLDCTPGTASAQSRVLASAHGGRYCVYRMDLNNDNRVCVDDLEGTLRSLSPAVRREEVESMLWEVDGDTKGYLTAADFKASYYRIRASKEADEPRSWFRCGGASFRPPSLRLLCSERALGWADTEGVCAVALVLCACSQAG